MTIPEATFAFLTGFIAIAMFAGAIWALMELATPAG